MPDDSFDVFVIGAGVAGMAAAEEAANRGLSVGIAEQSMFGGLAVNVNRLSPALEGLPATGSDLAADLMTRLADLGVTTVFEPVTRLARGPNGQIEVGFPSGSHNARGVIVASGARLRKLGVPGEERLENHGVSHCADCDAPMFKGQDVMVVGGGDSAVQEALVLAEFCSGVHLVHRGGGFSGRADFVEALRRHPRVTVHLRTVVESLEGDDSLVGARLRDLDSGQSRLQACRGFFAYVGLEPNTEFVSSSVDTASGAIRVDARCETSFPNVFAIGAARAEFPGLLSDAIQDSRVAVAAIRERL